MDNARRHMGALLCQLSETDDDDWEDDQFLVPTRQAQREGPRPKARAADARAVYNSGQTIQIAPESTKKWSAMVQNGSGLQPTPSAIPSEALRRPSEPRNLKDVVATKPPAFLLRGGKPNFTGDWLCYAAQGDIEAFMLEMEVSWARRTAAQCLSYGIGTLKRHINHEGNQFSVRVAGGPTEFEQKFRIGKGTQTSEGPDGAILVTPTWQQELVVSVDQTEMDGSIPFTWKQYFEGDELVLHMVAAEKECAVWHFRRIPLEGS